MKSAYELAMERLEKGSPSISLTEDQKKEIAEVDSVYRAKIAEKELFLKEEICKAQGAGNLKRQNHLRSSLPRRSAGCWKMRSEEREAAREFRWQSLIDKRLVERAVPCALLKFGRRRCELFCHRLRSSRSTFTTLWQIGIEKAEHVCALDRADAFLFLQVGNTLAELFHFVQCTFGRK